MDLLSMFDNIEIKNDTRVPVEDLKYIEELEQKFFKQRDFHFKMKELIESKEDRADYSDKERKYSRGSNYSSYIKRELQETNYSKFMNDSYYFMAAIYSYFKQKYNCQSLTTHDIYEKSRTFDAYERRIEDSFKKLAYFENITKDEVLDQIFEHLGGVSFEDKSRQEVIEYLKEQTKQYREDKKKVTVKGKKVTMIDFIYFDSWHPECVGGYGNSYDKLIGIIKAITLFEFDSVNNEILDMFIENRCKGNARTVGDYDFNLNAINKLKIFKNGRADIEFTTTTNAINFAREFLSYEI